ncbi:unnamed protein product, partial [Prorocentrum cordatum]
MGPREEAACRWYCKCCKNDRTGKQWWNMAHAKKCVLCGLAKRVTFGGNVLPSEPSVRAEPKMPPWKNQSAEAAGQAKIRELEAKIKELQAESKRGLFLSGDPMQVDAGEKDDEADMRKRLKEIDEQLAFVSKYSSESKAGAYLESLRAEKESLHCKLQESRPMYAKLQTMSNRLKTAEKRADASRELVAARKLQLGKMQKSLEQAEKDLTEQEKEVVSLSAQVQELTKQAPMAPESASLDEKGKGMAMDVGALGKMLEAQGIGSEQAAGLAQVLADSMGTLWVKREGQGAELPPLQQQGAPSPSLWTRTLRGFGLLLLVWRLCLSSIKVDSGLQSCMHLIEMPRNGIPLHALPQQQVVADSCLGVDDWQWDFQEFDDVGFDQDEFFGITESSTAVSTSLSATWASTGGSTALATGRQSNIDLRLKGVITSANVEGAGPFKMFMETC